MILANSGDLERRSLPEASASASLAFCFCSGVREEPSHIQAKRTPPRVLQFIELPSACFDPLGQVNSLGEF